MSDDGPADWIARVYADSGMSIAQARDLVILRCLEAGDATVFSYFILGGHQPGREVINSLAFMAAGEVPDKIADSMPFKFETKRRKSIGPGKRVDPLVVMRDELIELNIRARMADGLTRDAATGLVTDMISSSSDMTKGRSRKFETVRKARRRECREGN